MTATKHERQRRLVALLHDNEVRSQEEARALLADAGIETTQATVSRDLGEIGAVKVRGSDGAPVYRVGPESVPGTSYDRLVSALRQFVVAADASGNLAVLRTPPAGAGPVASAIDLADVPGVVATVAGDDTVLVVAAEGTSGRDLADELRRLAGID